MTLSTWHRTWLADVHCYRGRMLLGEMAVREGVDGTVALEMGRETEKAAEKLPIQSVEFSNSMLAVRAGGRPIF